MTDRNLHPDSKPERDDDQRSDAEQAIENADNARRGEVRNQGDDAQ